MPTPQIIQKSTVSQTVAENAKRLFQVVYQEQNKSDMSDDSILKIKVSDLISKMAFYYEKIRQSVEYKEEHLFRKNAIERILKRLIIIEGSLLVKGINGQEVVQNLFNELIRAGYLPNNQIPESKIDELVPVVEKYLKIKQTCLKQSWEDQAEKNRFARWVIAVLASDIEEKLGNNRINATAVKFMFDTLVKDIELPENSRNAKDLDIQIYLGIHRNLLKYDQDMLALILLKYFNADWEKPSRETMLKITANCQSLYRTIQDQIDHPLASQLNRIIGRYTVFFSILLDVIKDNPVAVYGSFKKDPKAFPRQIKIVCNKRYGQIRRKLWRAAIRSIIYIFITKSIFAIALEVPATQLFGQEINPLSLVVNISFPALLLFVIILLTRLPSDANTSKIVEGINELVFVEQERRNKFRLREPAQRSKWLSGVFGFIYAITFFLSFGFVIWVLDQIHFSWISITIFLFFLAFVSFFSIRIRKYAKELIITEPRENILTFITDFFYVPIVATGKWLSEKFSKINIFVFILDFIIEAPFKIFVEIAEEWTKYVKERKEEIV